jgi:hypothetical protein
MAELICGTVPLWRRKGEDDRWVVYVILSKNRFEDYDLRATAGVQHTNQSSQK